MRGEIWENLALGSLGAHVSHKAAQVAQGSSKLSPRGAQTAQLPKGHPEPVDLLSTKEWEPKMDPPRDAHNPQNAKPLSLTN